MHAQHVKQLLLFIVTTEQRVEWRKKCAATRATALENGVHSVLSGFNKMLLIKGIT